MIILSCLFWHKSDVMLKSTIFHYHDGTDTAPHRHEVIVGTMIFVCASDDKPDREDSKLHKKTKDLCTTNNSNASNASNVSIMSGFPLTIRKQPSGETFWIHVDPSFKISACKQKIQRMRGIPANNIRLSVPGSASENDSDKMIEAFQQQTLESLGLVETSDSEDDSHGPTLDMAPITLCVQLPTGRRIKLNDAVDVEATVDAVEELVAAELESAHLLEASDSSEERFRLYNERTPMHPGNPITKYQVKHMDVLKLKFGNEEASASQKEERKKAFRKSEAQKQERRSSVKESNSSENLREITLSPINRKQKRAVSSSPVREDITESPRRRRLVDRSKSANENQEQSPKPKNSLWKAPEELIGRLSQSLNNVRSGSPSPLRGRTNGNAEERRKMRGRRVSDTAIPAKGTTRSGSAGRLSRKQRPDNIPEEPDERRTGRFSGKLKSGEEEPREGRRSHSRSNSAGRMKSRSNSAGRSKSRRNSAGRSKSRSNSAGRMKSRSDSAGRMRKRSKSRSQSAGRLKRRGSGGKYQGRDQPRRKKKNDEDKSNERRRSRSNSQNRAEKETSERRRSRSKSKSSLKEEISERRRRRSRSTSEKGLHENRNGSSKSEAKIDRTPKRSNSDPRRRRTKERSTSIDERNKRSDAAHLRKWKSPLPQNQPAETDGIPDAFKISMHKAQPKKPTDGEEEGHSPISPVCVVTETLNMNYLVDDCNSEESSDIQSHETEMSDYIESAENTGKDISEFQPESTLTVITSEGVNVSEDDNTEKNVDENVEAFLPDRKERKKRTSDKANKSASKPNRMKLQELKKAKAKEETEALSTQDSKPDSCNTTDLSVSVNSEAAIIDKDRTSFRSQQKTDTNTTEPKKNITKPRQTFSQSQKEKSDKISAKAKGILARLNANLNTADFTSDSDDATSATADKDLKVLRQAKENNSYLEETIATDDQVVAEASKMADDAAQSEAKTNNPPPSRRSVVNRFKGVFDKEKPAEPQNREAVISTPNVAKAKGSPKIARKQKENLSVVRQAKAKFENEIEATNEGDTKEDVSENKAEEEVSRRRQRRSNSIGIPEQVMSENVFEVKATSGRTMRPLRPLRPSVKDTPSRSSSNATSVAEAAALAIAEAETKAALAASFSKDVFAGVESPVASQSDFSQSTGETSKKPLQSLAKDSPSVNSQASTKRGSVKDHIGKFQTGGKDNDSVKSPVSIKNRVGKFKTGGKDHDCVKSPVSIKDRVGKFQTGKNQNKSVKSPVSKDRKVHSGEKDNAVTKPSGSIKDRIGKPQNGAKEDGSAQAPKSAENANSETGAKDSPITKSPACIKDRIGKFGKEKANASGFQMIGLQALGLKNAVDGGTKKKENEKKDDDSASTTYSFFCSNDEESEYCEREEVEEEESVYEASDSSNSEDESSVDEEFDSIHVIGPDLTTFEIQLDSEFEKLGNIKQAVADASGIPVDELRLGLQSEESDIEDSHHILLDDNYMLNPGDILAVQPSTVIVKLPDGNSKLELSVFPGTVLSDIKEYIAESTGTTPSRQLLYDFQMNFNEELEDDTPISTDCILRLTVY